MIKLEKVCKWYGQNNILNDFDLHMLNCQIKCDTSLLKSSILVL